jgi:cation transport protein ChaC
MPEYWVFGYGSLIWRPGFPFVERCLARLNGSHRSLCVYSWVHRGTRESPGLVLGLDRGGTCLGLGFRVAEGDWLEVLAYLREREQVTAVYLERQRAIHLSDGRCVQALCFVVDRQHAQYAGVLTPDQQLEIIRHAEGQSGPNHEYVVNTATHLAELGIRDARLGWLASQLSSPWAA